MNSPLANPSMCDISKSTTPPNWIPLKLKSSKQDARKDTTHKLVALPKTLRQKIQIKATSNFPKIHSNIRKLKCSVTFGKKQNMEPIQSNQLQVNLQKTKQWWELSWLLSKDCSGDVKVCRKGCETFRIFIRGWRVIIRF
jgi:hypothetical protein